MKSVCWEGDWPLTQAFAANPARYAHFTVPKPGGGTMPMAGHNGSDFATPSGTLLLAPEDCYVQERSFDPTGYGQTLYLLGVSGRGYRYGHCLVIFVSQGETLAAGRILARSGNTGNSDGPHLHLGIRPEHPNATNGFSGYVDPAPILAAMEEDMSRVAELEAERDQLNGVVAELNTQVSDLKTEVGGLNGQNTTRQQQIDDLRAEIAGLQAAVAAGGGDGAELATLRGKLAQAHQITAP